ncbi:hypothetical protein M427DRAFT_55016 [Gonapodya prolifera JEL478]|uniref:Uncharacterized protein n=1 Tax=Gonapodya prolifera (strain JEL478) TaxID=1344416 RepID=A0A139AJL1_GONPJ|nr:hypothetical protein M427DRAFT_55016 [Gonapodya prolifera JEL478]|eukprot:KXS16990.1 hypothetical protein M427DRAFT_55016 [Gonapodya prolifera JEL478]
MPFSVGFIQFLNDFFPDVHSFVSFLFSSLGVDHLKCPSTEAPPYIFSPEVAAVTGTPGIRNPYLIPFQVLGIVVGLVGAMRRLQPGSPPVSPRMLGALLFFAGMNTSSLFAHNFLQKYTPSWELVRIVDVVFTGCSSLDLIFLALDAPSSKRPLAPWRTKLAHALDSLPSQLIVFIIIAVVNTLFDTRSGLLFPIPFVAELTYLGTAFAAFFILSPFLDYSNPLSYVAIAGALTGLACLPIDNVLCWHFGPESGSFWTTAGLYFLFLGCDLGVYGVTEVLTPKAAPAVKAKVNGHANVNASGKAKVPKKEE